MQHHCHTFIISTPCQLPHLPTPITSLRPPPTAPPHPHGPPGLLFSPSSERPQRSVKKGRLFERSEFLPFSVVQEASRRKK
ncbi:hypothetical protein DXA83_02065 [Bacteroides thetaiotaomicron]|nr:hypothetical protein DXA83_02065 [Bacteroides thetaiotaomicron]